MIEINRIMKFIKLANLAHFKTSSWFKFSLALAALMLFATLALKIITPPATPTPKTELMNHNYDGSQTTFGKVKFSGTSPHIKGQLSLAKVETLAIGTVVEKIKQNYQLQTKDKQFWIGPDYTLYFDAANNFYVLSQNNPTKSKNFVNLNQALKVARPLIKNLFDAKLEPILTQVSYLNGNADLHKTEANLARYLKIPFSYMIDGYPLLLEQDNYYPLSLLINGQQEIQKLTFKPMLFSIKKLAEKPTISVAQAIDNINHGSAAIIAAQNKQLFKLNLVNLTQVNLTRVQLEYRRDKNGLALPYYHFFGEAKNKKGQTFQVEMITPAVKR